MFYEIKNILNNSDGLKGDGLSKIISKARIDAGVLLIQLPQIDFDKIDKTVVKNKGYFAYPPQGLLYVSAMLNNSDIQTDIIDLNYHVLKKISESDTYDKQEYFKYIDDIVKSKKIDFVCFSLMFDATIPILQELTDYLRNNNNGIVITVGGVGATANYQVLLEKGIVDIVFLHEAETAFEDFISYCRGLNQDLPQNLAFNNNNVIQKTGEKPGGSPNIDITNQYNKIPIDDYHNIGMASIFGKLDGKDKPYATILTRRGCRGMCSFCSVRNFNGKGVRVRESGSVIDEMKYLYNNYNIQHFELLDDDFLYNLHEVKKLLIEIKNILPGITRSANNGLIAGSLDDEIMQLMVESGCVGFKVGLESGNSDILRKVHKPITLEKYLEFTKLAKKYPELFISVNFILGTPGETFGQMKDSFNIALEGGLDRNNFYLYQHLKNTELDLLFHEDGEHNRQITDIGKEYNQPQKKGTNGGFNPVRNGEFTNNNDGKLSGLEIFQLDNECVPTRDQLVEIRFTFNIIVNFLRSPAMTGSDPKVIQKGINRIKLLGKSYPNDPLMMAQEIFLLRKNRNINEIECLDQKDQQIKDIVAKSEYRIRRNKEFNFLELLDNNLPNHNIF